MSVSILLKTENVKKKKIFWHWLVIGAILLAVVFVFRAYSLSYYWAGIEIDEDLLMELCGITGEEYLSEEFNPNDCPEAELAIEIVGGKSTIWIAVAFITFLALIVYMAPYAVLQVQGPPADSNIKVSPINGQGSMEMQIVLTGIAEQTAYYISINASAGGESISANVKLLVNQPEYILVVE